MLSIQGLENVPAIRFVIAFAIIFVLLALFALILRRLKGSKLSLSGDRGRARQPRLGIVDVYDLDRQRQLILLRRDNVEHLLLVGGPNDVVVETNIVRSPGARLSPVADTADADRMEPASSRPALETVSSRPELPSPAPTGEVAPFPSPAAGRGPNANRNAAPARAPAAEQRPDRARATPTAAAPAGRPTPPPQPPQAVSEKPTTDGDRAVLSGMARDLEDALKRPQEPVVARPPRNDIARLPSAPLPARLEPSAPPAATQAARPRPDPGPRFPRPTPPAARPTPPPPQPPVVETPPPGPELLPDSPIAFEPPPPVIALPAPGEPDTATGANEAQHGGTPDIAAPPPEIAPPPAPIPEPPRPIETPTRSDPFSIEDIEAEFARLLGRPLDRRDKI